MQRTPQARAQAVIAGGLACLLEGVMHPRPCGQLCLTSTGAEHMWRRTSDCLQGQARHCVDELFGTHCMCPAGIEVITCVGHTLYNTEDICAKHDGRPPLSYKVSMPVHVPSFISTGGTAAEHSPAEDVPQACPAEASCPASAFGCRGMHMNPLA